MNVKRLEYRGDILYTLIFADDQVIIATDADDVKYMFRKLKVEYGIWDLTVKMSKTEYLKLRENDVEDLQFSYRKHEHVPVTCVRNELLETE